MIGQGLLEALVLVVLLESMGLLVAVWIPCIGHNILFGHATFGADVFDTGWEVVEDDLNLAQSWDAFAATLVAAAGQLGGETGLLSEHEGGGFVEREFVFLRVSKRLKHF